MVETGKTTARNRPEYILLLIVIAGLIIRVVYLIQLGGSELWAVLTIDADFYVELARQMSSGAGIPGGAISFNPLYPVYLVSVFRLFGGGLLMPRILQSILGLVNICLLYVAGRRLVNPRGRGTLSGDATGLLAAALGMLYPQFVLYEGSLLATSLVTFFLLASFTTAIILDQDVRGVRRVSLGSHGVPSSLLSLLLGGLLGAGALGRPNLFLILVPAVSVWLFFRSPGRGGGLRRGILCIAGAVILLLPPIIYNASRTGSFVPVTTHGGINFYVGNRPGARGFYDPPEGMREDMRGLIEDAKLEAERNVGRGLTDSEASDYWFNAAVDGILRSPGGWLGLLGRKLLLFWNGVEIPDLLDISFYREACPVMNIMFIPFAVLSPLSLLGIIVLIKVGRNRSVVLLFVLSGLASVLLFYVNSRYRVPSVPVIILTCALFISALIKWIEGREWKFILAAACMFAAIFFLVSNRNMVMIERSAAYTTLGNHYMRIKEEAKAEDAFAEAYRLAPEKVMTHINYARILLLRGNLERAGRLYDSAFSIDPDFPMLAVEYGSLLEQASRTEKARELFLFAYRLERKRDRILACKLLSRLAFADGKRDEAVTWIKRALEIVPGDDDLIKLLHRVEGEP